MTHAVIHVSNEMSPQAAENLVRLALHQVLATRVDTYATVFDVIATPEQLVELAWRLQADGARASILTLDVSAYKS